MEWRKKLWQRRQKKNWKYRDWTKDTLTDDLGLCDDHGGILCLCGIRQLILDPNSLAPGGITGIAIILNRLFGIETGTWMLLINIPILLIGIWNSDCGLFCLQSIVRQ